MSCMNPRLAVDYGVMPDTGKHKIKFVPQRVDYNINLLRSRYGESLLLLPCGQCLGCKFDIARDWATRCVCEALYHQESCFVTLTYDDVHVPPAVNREDPLDFIKALRNRGAKIRYFGCAEYGSTTNRPHYHLIIFGFRPSDLALYSKGSKGFYLYTSSYLESLWNKGFVIVGDLSFDSAGYVARYATKKLGDQNSFLMMSNRPGIGYQYLVDHAKEMIKDGCIYGSFGNVNSQPIPRYFDEKLRVMFPEEYQKLVSRRLDDIRVVDNGNMINLGVSNLEQLKDHQASIVFDRLARIGRL